MTNIVSLKAFLNSFKLPKDYLKQIIKETTSLTFDDFVSKYSSIYESKGKINFQFNEHKINSSESFDAFNSQHSFYIKYMNPLEFKTNGITLIIKWNIASTIFGELFIAAIEERICFINFLDRVGSKDRKLNIKTNIEYLNQMFSVANPILQKIENIDDDEIFRETQNNLCSALRSTNTEANINIEGIIVASSFQRKVWEALLLIPVGQFTSYKNIAAYIGHPKAYRAVGTAVGQNPLSIIIPCHRVIASNGSVGGYSGGLDNKLRIILSEWTYDDA